MSQSKSLLFSATLEKHIELWINLEKDMKYFSGVLKRRADLSRLMKKIKRFSTTFQLSKDKVELQS
jgi:hypothetical protein